MTIRAEIIMNDIFFQKSEPYKRAVEELNKIKNTLIEYYTKLDPKFLINSCEIMSPLKQRGTSAIVDIKLVPITCLNFIDISIAGYKMNSMFITDIQTNDDITYDPGFFYYKRNDCQYCSDSEDD